MNRTDDIDQLEVGERVLIFPGVPSFYIETKPDEIKMGTVTAVFKPDTLFATGKGVLVKGNDGVLYSNITMGHEEAYGFFMAPDSFMALANSIISSHQDKAYMAQRSVNRAAQMVQADGHKAL